MVEQTIQISNKLGMHARAAAKFVQTAAHYESQIVVIKDGQEVNGKSIMGIMMLAAARGAAITIRATGEDEQHAVDALAALVHGKFGEPQ